MVCVVVGNGAVRMLKDVFGVVVVLEAACAGQQGIEWMDKVRLGTMAGA